ncbi:MAG: Hpt domain-containing protein [Bacteroidales bacterium]|nr:Hpt domain-containing protein [Bacteroidales bacterium]
MLDIHQFESTYGDFGAEMISEIIDIYLAEYDQRFDLMANNIRDLDFKSLGANAHSFKGATAVLYDAEVAELARQLEYKGKEENADGLMDLFTQLRAEADKLIVQLKQLKKKYS